MEYDSGSFERFKTYEGEGYEVEKAQFAAVGDDYRRITVRLYSDAKNEDITDTITVDSEDINSYSFYDLAVSLAGKVGMFYATREGKKADYALGALKELQRYYHKNN